jgi:ribosomal protein S11
MARSDVPTAEDSISVVAVLIASSLNARQVRDLTELPWDRTRPRAERVHESRR